MPATATLTASDAKAEASASERVVVSMSKAEKAQLERRAAAAGVSVDDFVRLAVELYDPTGEETRMLEAMVRHIEKMGQEILDDLDAATAQVKATRTYLAERRGTP